MPARKPSKVPSKPRQLVFFGDEAGQTHVQVNFKSKSALGRFLDNTAVTPFTHPVFGRFESMEGYWHYVRSGYQHKYLRKLFGEHATIAGHCVVPVENPKFHQQIADGLRCKILQTPRLVELLTVNTLPVVVYDEIDHDETAIIKHRWFTDLVAEIQKELACPSKTKSQSTRPALSRQLKNSSTTSMTMA